MRTDKSTYFSAYTTMLHYEEATEMYGYKPYDVKNITLEREVSYFLSRYCFKIDVS